MKRASDEMATTATQAAATSVTGAAMAERPLLVDIEVLPCHAAGKEQEEIIMKAISVISHAKVKYDVHAFGTTIEGAPIEMRSLLSQSPIFLISAL